MVMRGVGKRLQVDRLVVGEGRDAHKGRGVGGEAIGE